MQYTDYFPELLRQQQHGLLLQLYRFRLSQEQKNKRSEYSRLMQAALLYLMYSTYPLLRFQSAPADHYFRQLEKEPKWKKE